MLLEAPAPAGTSSIQPSPGLATPKPMYPLSNLPVICTRILLGSDALLTTCSSAPPSSLKGPATDASLPLLLLLLPPARLDADALLLLPSALAGHTPRTLSLSRTHTLSGSCKNGTGT
jgi:hypothetical protein